MCRAFIVARPRLLTLWRTPRAARASVWGTSDLPKTSWSSISWTAAPSRCLWRGIRAFCRRRLSSAPTGVSPAADSRSTGRMSMKTW